MLQISRTLLSPLHLTVTGTALGHMRERYTTPTNEALIALATRLQWIAVAIDIPGALRGWFPN
jgi:hypothetical protein